MRLQESIFAKQNCAKGREKSENLKSHNFFWIEKHGFDMFVYKIQCFGENCHIKMQLKWSIGNWFQFKKQQQKTNLT